MLSLRFDLFVRGKRSADTGSGEVPTEKWEYFNLTGDTMEIDSGVDRDQGETADNGRPDKFRPASDSSLKWHRENPDVAAIVGGKDEDEDLGYFFDSAWEPDAYTSKFNLKYFISFKSITKHFGAGISKVKNDQKV